MTDQLQTCLADSFTIERRIGSGGMSEVYLAWDLRNERRVAIKVLRPEHTAAVGRQRFLQEIRIVSKLQHPNILPLYNSGQIDGYLFYIMPYVTGEVLRAKMDREPRLSLDETAAIVEPVARALDYAHRHHVVHRDIKPDNVLLHEGQPILADFGIALAQDLTDEWLTGTGQFLGTPHYMSPEQAAGDGELDGRSDVYGLGCLVFEMLSGRPPFIEGNARAIMAQHVNHQAPRLITLRADIHPAACQAVKRALSKDPAHRFASAGAFAAALTSRCAHVAASLPKSIAVLPFVNLSDDPANGHLGDGLTEEIINALANVGGIKVAARTSTFVYKGNNRHVCEIGSNLNVDTVLEGSVRESGSQLRVTAQLIDVADGFHMWSGRFDREKRNGFDIQDDLAKTIVAILRDRLGESSRGQVGDVE